MPAGRYSNRIPDGHFAFDDGHAASRLGHSARSAKNEVDVGSAARARARGRPARRGREARRSSCRRCHGSAGRARGHQEGQEGSRRGRGSGRGRACREGKEEVTRSKVGQPPAAAGLPAFCSRDAKQSPHTRREAQQVGRMRLIVGLGNPGIEYAWTPHNLGFLVVDALAEDAGIRVTRPEAKSLVGLGQIAGREVVLAKPQTMMNLSGLAVRELVSRAECEPSEMIVVCDDIALPWGMLRVRERGTAGGHNGLKSVIGAIGTTEFVRVRLGVKPEEMRGDLKEYVLRQIRRDEEDLVSEEIEQGAEAVKVILAEGTQSAMNRFNRRVSPQDEEESEE